jgi:hypothetical protein
LPLASIDPAVAVHVTSWLLRFATVALQADVPFTLTLDGSQEAETEGVRGLDATVRVTETVVVAAKGPFESSPEKITVPRYVPGKLLVAEIVAVPVAFPESSIVILPLAGNTLNQLPPLAVVVVAVQPSCADGAPVAVIISAWLIEPEELKEMALGFTCISATSGFQRIVYAADGLDGVNV